MRAVAINSTQQTGTLNLRNIFFRNPIQLELELIQTQMTQKPMLRAEVHAMRASQNRK